MVYIIMKNIEVVCYNDIGVLYPWTNLAKIFLDGYHLECAVDCD